jgi:hypothetical protein
MDGNAWEGAAPGAAPSHGLPPVGFTASLTGLPGFIR